MMRYVLMACAENLTLGAFFCWFLGLLLFDFTICLSLDPANVPFLFMTLRRRLRR